MNTIIAVMQCQGVQRPGKPGNVREFRCKEKSQGIFKKTTKVTEKSGNFVV